MNSSVRSAALLIAGCGIAAPLWAADGVLIVQKVTSGSGTAVTHQIAIEPHRMRLETGGTAPGSEVFIFDGMHQVMLLINEGSKTYSEITKADVDALSGQMSAAMAQMQDTLKNLPPERRAQVEAMMKGRMGGAGSTEPKTEFHKTGTATVGKWTCDKYDGFTNGQKTIELCTVDPKALGFGSQDFGVTKDFAEFFSKLPIMRGAASQPFHIGTVEEQGYAGVPIRSVVTTNGQTITTELVDVKRQAFPDSTFQAPTGFTKQDSPFGRGRRGGGE